MADKTITALLLARGRVAWTTLKDRKGAMAVAVQQDAAFEAPAETTDLYALEVADAIKGKVAGIRGPLTAAIPAELVLFRAVRLPSTDPAELRNMADLQADKFSPFLAEHSAMAIEILNAADGQSLVLMATVLRDHIDRLGALCARAGMFPQAVDVDVMGWWQLLKDENRIPAHGRQLILVLTAGESTLLLAQDAQLLAVRSLGAGLAGDELTAEIQYTLTTAETEWGMGELGPLQVWHDGRGDWPTVQAMQKALSISVDAHELTALPPLTDGLARRAATRAPTMLDLAPADWKASLRNLQMRKTAFAASAAILAVWLTGALVLFGGLFVHNRRLREARMAVEAQKQPLATVRQLKAQIDALERYGDRSRSGVEVLREICERLPTGVDLSFLSYSKTWDASTNAAAAADRRYAEVSLRGESDSSDPIYGFFAALEKSPLFRKVTPEGVTDTERQGQRRAQFRVRLDLPEEKP
jgi:hypothetical protein